jgi:prevent-host-death family protein
MPNIKPISDLRNYTEVLSEVNENSPVYLTRNGRGEYVIIKLQELDKLKAKIRLLEKLAEGEASVQENDWISTGDVDKMLGL